MLLRIGDTIINTDHITQITYNGEVVPGNEEYRTPGRTQSLVIEFLGGGGPANFHGPTAASLWEYLSKDVKTLE